MLTRFTALARTGRTLIATLGALAALTLGAHEATAQSPAIIQRGDAVVTGFAGTTPPGADLPVDIHPLDRTYIDRDGITMRIFDLSRLGGGPQGQLADASVRFRLKARDIGHVFGIAFDGDGRNGPPNIYLTATSLHGLQLMAPGPDGVPVRVMTGRPGAQWMAGLFGSEQGGGPGSIWKVDGRTGAVTLFANITNGDLENSGAGLGAIAFDPRSGHLYASDMETGLVWRIALDGRVIDAYDHGSTGRAAAGLAVSPYNPASRTDRTQVTFNTEIPETWGFTEPERRVFGLAVENGRLYYSVADGPKIWSVGLGTDGQFGADARLEIDVTGTPAGSAVSSIMFDGAGMMYLAQRGAPLGNYDYSAFAKPQQALVLRYRWSDTDRRWTPKPEEYAIGLPPEHRATLGGVALNYGFDRFGSMDYGRCRQTLWTTGEHLRSGSDIVRVTNGGPRLVHGLQGNYKHRVRPDNEPPFEAWYIDYDGRFEDGEAYGHIGNVGIFAPCEGGRVELTQAEIPVWTAGPNLVVEKRCYSGAFGGKVRCTITVRNIGTSVPGDTVEIIDATRILWGPGAGSLIPIATATPDGAEWVCAANAAGEYVCRVPGAVFVPGSERTLEVWVDTRELLLNGNLGFRNCVTLKHPDGQGKACAEGGTEITVKKTGPAECKPGFGCKFGITISNTGTTPYAGDLLLADSLFVNGANSPTTIASIQPPLGCGPDPVALPFSCVANVSLAAGESRTHWITVNMPAPGNYWAQNCFGVTDPWLIADAGLIGKLLQPVKLAGAGQPGGNPSCTWVKVPGQAISPVQGQNIPSSGTSYTPIGLLPPAWTCPDGRSPLANGRCPCPVNAPWNPETNSCGWRPVCWDNVRLRPNGTCCPWGAVWWPQTQSCQAPPVFGCPDVYRRTPDGACCAKGSRWIDGQCRSIEVNLPCSFGQFRNLQGLCINVGFPLALLPLAIPGKPWTCPDGRPRLANGNCLTIACPLNAPYSAKTGRCERPQVGGVTGCAAGQTRLVSTGQCAPIGLPPCGIGQARNAQGQCATSTLRLPAGPSPSVGAGQQGGPKTVNCPGKLVPNAQGVCVPPGIAGTLPKPVLVNPVKPPVVVTTKPPVVVTKPPVVETKPVITSKPPAVQQSKPDTSPTRSTPATRSQSSSGGGSGGGGNKQPVAKRANSDSKSQSKSDGKKKQ